MFRSQREPYTVDIKYTYRLVLSITDPDKTIVKSHIPCVYSDGTLYRAPPATPLSDNKNFFREKTKIISPPSAAWAMKICNSADIDYSDVYKLEALFTSDLNNLQFFLKQLLVFVTDIAGFPGCTSVTLNRSVDLRKVTIPSYLPPLTSLTFEFNNNDDYLEASNKLVAVCYVDEYPHRYQIGKKINTNKEGICQYNITLSSPNNSIIADFIASQNGISSPFAQYLRHHNALFKIIGLINAIKKQDDELAKEERNPIFCLMEKEFADFNDFLTRCSPGQGRMIDKSIEKELIRVSYFCDLLFNMPVENSPNEKSLRDRNMQAALGSISVLREGRPPYKSPKNLQIVEDCKAIEAVSNQLAALLSQSQPPSHTAENDEKPSFQAPKAMNLKP